MEHRLKKRCQVSLSVVVRGRDELTLHGTARDISLDGMFIQLDQCAVLANTVVEIELSPCGCLHGWVVHTRDEGVGVMFFSIGSNERDRLGQLLLE